MYHSSMLQKYIFSKLGSVKAAFISVTQPVIQARDSNDEREMLARLTEHSVELLQIKILSAPGCEDFVLFGKHSVIESWLCPKRI